MRARANNSKFFGKILRAWLDDAVQLLACASRILVIVAALT
jgi:hypothetical protein